MTCVQGVDNTYIVDWLRVAEFVQLLVYTTLSFQPVLTQSYTDFM